MSNVSIAKRYSQALFELASATNTLAETQNDLGKVLEIIDEHEELKKVVNHKMIHPGVKQEIFKEVFTDKISPVTLDFLLLLAQKRREYVLNEIVAQFIVLANAAAGIVKAKVKSAIEISPEQLEELRQKLAKATGKNVLIELEIDETVMGGMIVRIGDTIIDGSVSNRLKLLEKHLKSVELI